MQLCAACQWPTSYMCAMQLHAISEGPLLVPAKTMSYTGMPLMHRTHCLIMRNGLCSCCHSCLCPADSFLQNRTSQIFLFGLYAYARMSCKPLAICFSNMASHLGLAYWQCVWLSEYTVSEYTIVPADLGTHQFMDGADCSARSSARLHAPCLASCLGITHDHANVLIAGRRGSPAGLKRKCAWGSAEASGSQEVSTFV